MSMLGQLVGPGRSNLSFVDYCRQHIVLDNRQPYDPTARPVMAEIVDALTWHPHISLIKGAQIGASTLFLAHALHLVDVMGKNAIYYLPTDRMAERFGPTRFDPYVQRSLYLSERLKGTDQAGLKQIGTSFLYFLGLVSKTGAISIPADAILFDEVPLINQENMELAQDRISAPGSLGWQRYFSVALFPKDSIDELYESSDQRVWLVKCQGCGREAALEEEFPENIGLKGSEVFLVCPACGHRLDVGAGKWVPQHPERSHDRRGYRVPQLAIPGANLQQIWRRWKQVQDKPNKRAQFRRSALGLADSGNLQPVGPEVIKRVEEASDYYWQDYSDQVTGIGIDMGDGAHIAVVAPYGADGIRPIAFFHVDVEDLLGRIPFLEARYNAGALVIDAMPYKPTSKAVVRSLARARGYIQYFSGTDLKEGEEGEDDRRVRKVTVDRDESLDETTDLFATVPPLALLPKPKNTAEEQMLREVKLHLQRLVKEEVESPDGGKRVRYKKNVPNHFGMALNSARIALYYAVGRAAPKVKARVLG